MQCSFGSGEILLPPRRTAQPSQPKQPVRETPQPVKALRSITNVQWRLKNNEAVLNPSAESVRIREVVDAPSTKPTTTNPEPPK